LNSSARRLFLLPGDCRICGHRFHRKSRASQRRRHACREEECRLRRKFRRRNRLVFQRREPPPRPTALGPARSPLRDPEAGSWSSTLRS